jgi:hypothetical protein
MRSIAGRKTDAIAKFSRHEGSKIAEATTQVNSRQPGNYPQTTDPVDRFSRPLAARLPVSLSSLAADCCSDNRPTPDSAGAEESPAPGLSAPPADPSQSHQPARKPAKPADSPDQALNPHRPTRNERPIFCSGTAVAPAFYIETQRRQAIAIQSSTGREP